MTRFVVPRSTLMACALLAILLGGCLSGSGRDTVSVAGAPAVVQRGVRVPTQLSAGGGTAPVGSLVILGVN